MFPLAAVKRLPQLTVTINSQLSRRLGDWCSLVVLVGWLADVVGTFKAGSLALPNFFIIVCQSWAALLVVLRRRLFLLLVMSMAVLMMILMIVVTIMMTITLRVLMIIGMVMADIY